MPFDANAGGIAAPLGGVLALDLSSVVGYAYGLLSDRRPEFGTIKLPKFGGEGARYVGFENELAKAVKLFKPAHIIMESPLPLMAMAMNSTQAVAAQQFTLRGIVVMEAYRGRASRSEIDALTVRREVLGESRPKDVKVAVVRACRKRGWQVPDHNAADACLTWEWHRMRMKGVAPVAAALGRNGMKQAKPVKPLRVRSSAERGRLIKSADKRAVRPADVPAIKGMLLRGDVQSDIAAFFGTNGGRVCNINRGVMYRDIKPWPPDRLPPPGPYLAARWSYDARDTLVAMRDLISDVLTKFDEESAR